MPTLHHRLKTAVNGLSQSEGSDYVYLSDPRLDASTERNVEAFLMSLQPESHEGYAVAMFADSSGTLLGLAKTEYSRFEADSGRRSKAVHTHLRLTDSNNPGALLALGQLAANFPMNEVIPFPSNELLDEYKRLVLSEVLPSAPSLGTSLPTRPELERFLCLALAYGERREAIAIAMNADAVYPLWCRVAGAISTLPFSLRQRYQWGTGLAGTPEVDFFMRSGVMAVSPTAQDAIAAAKEYAAFLIEESANEPKLISMACSKDIQNIDDLRSAIQQPQVTSPPAAEVQGAPMPKSSKGSASPADPPDGRVNLTPDIREELRRQYAAMKDELTQQLAERLNVLESAIKQNPPKPAATVQVSEDSIQSWLANYWKEALTALALVAVLVVVGIWLLRPPPATSGSENTGTNTVSTTPPVVQASSTPSTDTIPPIDDLARKLNEEPATAEKLCNAISKSVGLEKTKSTVSDKQKTRFAELAQKFHDNQPLTGDDLPAIRKGFFEYIIARNNTKSAITIDLDPVEVSTRESIKVANALHLDPTRAKPTDQQFQTDVVIAYIDKNKSSRD